MTALKYDSDPFSAGDPFSEIKEAARDLETDDDPSASERGWVSC